MCSCADFAITHSSTPRAGALDARPRGRDYRWPRLTVGTTVAQAGWRCRAASPICARNDAKEKRMAKRTHESVVLVAPPTPDCQLESDAGGIFVVFDGQRIAKRGKPDTPQ